MSRKCVRTLCIVIIAVLLGASDPECVPAVAGDPLEGAQVQVLPVAEVDVSRNPEVAVSLVPLLVPATASCLTDLTALKRLKNARTKKISSQLSPNLKKHC